ncbi:killer cell lectin-like receptor subfamily B member 1B allele A [Larimichthys crocea]|uniref:Uncharacterized protein n=1 Tax=Larimichthys crocea TaxID=215358 RepID=A0ACD3RFH6_LARCR|nr:killer cell lectin-like receptor subfamily B member 1B allele A [Larimichthys crocea]TMS18224.1 Lithostathine-2 [Larimichthys crocea]
MASVFHFGLLLLISGQLLLTATAAPTNSPEVTTSVTGCPSSQSDCTSGWVKFQGRSFKLLQVPLNFGFAVFSCFLRNASLLKIKTRDEIPMLAAMVHAANPNITSVWTGAIDTAGIFQASDRRWRWTDGSLVNKTYITDESDGSCIKMKTGGITMFKSEECDESLPYICSKNV